MEAKVLSNFHATLRWIGRLQASLDTSITIHALRHSAATHLLENGENILDVQKRLGHARITTTMIYLHVADIEPARHVRLIDTLFPPKK